MRGWNVKRLEQISCRREISFEINLFFLSTVSMTTSSENFFSPDKVDQILSFIKNSATREKKLHLKFVIEISSKLHCMDFVGNSECDSRNDYP